MSHRAAKILQERIREFVNDLRMETVSLNKPKHTDAKTEILTHTNTECDITSHWSKGPPSKVNKQETLERVLGKGNPLALLVGM